MQQEGEGPSTAGRPEPTAEPLERALGGVAHDLNNALTAISGFSELILSRVPAEAPSARDATRIRVAAERAIGLVGKLLAYARPGAVPLPGAAAAAPRPERTGPAQAARDAALRGAETVLVAEDEELVRDLVVRVLRAHGYRTIEARSGADALAAAAEHDGPIHLLVTDVVMPRISGWALAERLVAARPDLRVVYMSGHEHEAPPPGGPPFLRKPFTPEALLRAARRVLDEPARA